MDLWMWARYFREHNQRRVRYWMLLNSYYEIYVAPLASGSIECLSTSIEFGSVQSLELSVDTPLACWLRFRIAAEQQHTPTTPTHF